MCINIIRVKILDFGFCNEILEFGFCVKIFDFGFYDKMLDFGFCNEILEFRIKFSDLKLILDFVIKF